MTAGLPNQAELTGRIMIANGTVQITPNLKVGKEAVLDDFLARLRAEARR